MRFAEKKTQTDVRAAIKAALSARSPICRTNGLAISRTISRAIDNEIGCVIGYVNSRAIHNISAYKIIIQTYNYYTNL